MFLELCCPTKWTRGSQIASGVTSDKIDSSEGRTQAAFVKKASSGSRKGTKVSSAKAPHSKGTLEDHLTRDRRLSVTSKEIKILLLGNGQSGKSTFLNQMRILYNHSFDNASECAFYISIINWNLLETLKTLLSAMDQERVELTSEEALELKRQFLEFYSQEYLPHLANSMQTIPQHLGGIISGIWRDTHLQEFYGKTSDIQVIENARYFIENADRICCPEYTPTKQDILQSQKHTMGTTELTFSLEGSAFRITDVGGQRSQRRKWVSLFDHMDCILFFVALSGYNLLLEEDRQTNRMQEALRVFSDVTSTQFLDFVQVILFLNKTDLFREKLKIYPLSICFQDYSGPNQFGPAIEYVASQFRDHCVKQDLHTHCICSTDTSYIQRVFQTVSVCLLRQMIEHIVLN